MSEVSELSLYQSNPKEAKLRAKELYFRGCKQREIADSLGMPFNTLRSLVNGTSSVPGWRDEKREVEEKALRAVHNEAKTRYAGMLTNTLSVVERSLAALNTPLRGGNGELLVDPDSGKPLLPVVGVSQMEKLVKMAGTLQALHNDAEERGATAAGRVRGASKITLTVEKVLTRLQEVDPIGYGADDWGDEANDTIEVDYDVIR